MVTENIILDGEGEETTDAPATEEATTEEAAPEAPATEEAAPEATPEAAE